jgi:hypothetical protein
MQSEAECITATPFRQIAHYAGICHVTFVECSTLGEFPVTSLQGAL